jgi:peptidoglycan/xylan/chitin deacetylase (PgdA/CDA1 family)
MRVVSFCFDDGFRATADKVRAIFEARGLHASFCVLAAPGQAQDPFIRGAGIADWGYWRDAAAGGHEVAPHGWAHERLGEMPLPAACESLDRTLQTFAREMPGFEARDQLFHLAYLAAPEPVVDHIAGLALGVRRRIGRDGLNPLQGHRRGGSVDCITFGDGADGLLEARLTRFVADEAGWLVVVLHGLDGEGWGPVCVATLSAALDRLLEAGAQVRPAGQVMRQGLGEA